MFSSYCWINLCWSSIYPMLNESLSETERSNCDPIPLCGLIENLIVYLKNLIVTESLSETEGVIERFLRNSMETQYYFHWLFKETIKVKEVKRIPSSGLKTRKSHTVLEMKKIFPMFDLDAQLIMFSSFPMSISDRCSVSIWPGIFWHGFCIKERLVVILKVASF